MLQNLIATFPILSVALAKEPDPIAILLPPDVLSSSAKLPIAMLSLLVTVPSPIEPEPMLDLIDQM